jgi:hypothetical protein
VRLTDDLHLRLEYYRHIHRFRSHLRQAVSRPPPSRTFDFSLSVKNGLESKEYDFVDRQQSELLIVLARMKEEVE